MVDLVVLIKEGFETGSGKFNNYNATRFLASIPGLRDKDKERALKVHHILADRVAKGELKGYQISAEGFVNLVDRDWRLVEGVPWGTIELGGPGSGHHGHKGIPGSQGGSVGSKGWASTTMMTAAVDAGTIERLKKDTHERATFVSDRMHIKENGDVIVKPDPPKDVLEAWGREGQSLAGNEVAAYQLSEELGLKVVPPTVLKEQYGQRSSLQTWQTDCKSGKEVSAKDIDPATMRKTLILDHVINNPDRHGNNYLVKEDGTLSAIDNGSAFFEHSIKPASDLGGAYIGGTGESSIRLTGAEKIKFTSVLNNKPLWKALPLNDNQKAEAQARLSDLIKTGSIVVEEWGEEWPQFT